MALITGSDCALTIDAKDYGDVVNKFDLSFTTDSLTYDTLKGQKAGPGKETAKLSITFAYDSGAASSLFDTLWTGRGKDVAFVATVGASTYTGKAIAVRPSVPANAGAVSEVTVDMDVDGEVVQGKVAAAKAGA
jgi:hypothetical protein